MKEIDELCRRLDVPEKVREKGKSLQRSLEEFSFTGKKKGNFPPSIVYVACREMGVPRSYEDVADASGIDKEIIVDYVKLLFEKLDLHLPPYDPRDCLTYLVEKLGLPENVEDKAEEILEDTKSEIVVSGKDPFVVSAGVVQIACSSTNAEITQKEIAETANVSAPSVRSVRKGGEED